MQVVHETYLRKDIGCGLTSCPQCPSSAYQLSNQACLVRDPPLIILPTVEVLLCQIDLLEQTDFLESTQSVLLLSVVERAKSIKHKTYNRLVKNVLKHENSKVYVFANSINRDTFVEREEGEAEEKFDDRVVRKASWWYKTHFESLTEKGCINLPRVVTLTNDPASAEDMRARDIDAMTIHDYVKEFLADKYPDILDVLSKPITPEERKAAHASGGFLDFPKHWSTDRIERGLANETLYKGKINVLNASGRRAEAVVHTEGLERPITIDGYEHMNRAINQDIVAVMLIDEDAGTRVDVDSEAKGKEENKLKGKVVGVIEKNWRGYCGSLEETDKQGGHVLFVPIDFRIPKIRIETQKVQALMDKRIIVTVDNWASNSRYPSGHILRTIGALNDIEVETEVLLLEHDIKHDKWSNDVLKCLPDNKVLPKDETNLRQDLRSGKPDERIIFSVDPPGCVDIDDALHCKLLDDGNYECGVHIADVAHYIKPDSALDLEAAVRGTSVYLVDRRIDMLPQLLSTDLCSLHTGVDRYAFSVVWKITPKAEILDTWFHRSIIHSSAALAYADAQKRIDTKKPDDEITRGCIRMMSIAKQLKANRKARGALNLESSEQKFKLNDKKMPEACMPYPMYDANFMIEEFMLLANITVAKRILQQFPKIAMLRRHPTPTPVMLEPLVKAAKLKGVAVSIESSKKLSDSIDNAKSKDIENFDSLLRMKAIKCLTQAVYFSSGDYDPEQYRHYGLASEIYTHFTSPIRRYADIVVHRQLANAIGISPIPESLQDRNRFKEVCDNINQRHWNAQYVSRASNELFTLFFLEKKGEQILKAIISDVRKTSVWVWIEQYCFERRVNIVTRDDLEGTNPWEFNENNMSLSRTSPPCVMYKLHDVVKVKVWVHTSKMHRKKIRIEILDEKFSKENVNESSRKRQADAVLDGKGDESEVSPGAKRIRLEEKATWIGQKLEEIQLSSTLRL